MDDSKRTKILGGVLAGIVGFMIGKPIVMGPIEDAQKQLLNAERSYSTASEKDWQVDQAKQLIEDTRLISLPHSVSDAQRLYQTWITNLAEQCKFAQRKVTPGRTEKRAGKYIAVSVDVEAEASLENLSRFLYLFEQVDLKHRVASLEIESTGSQGNPRMEIKLTAEGISVAGTPSKADVFARTRLPEKTGPDTTSMVVSESADFPEKFPFLAQVGREMIRVHGAEGNSWEVERGIEGTTPVEHLADEYIQLFDENFDRRNVDFEHYSQFVNASLFTKPTPEKVYRPTFDVANKTIEPGRTLRLTIKPRDINMDLGKASIDMEGGLDGMTYDNETGVLEWTPLENAEADRHELKFILTQQNNDELRVEKTMTVTVQPANAAPTLDVTSEVVVILGRDFSMELKADDDGDLDDLKYSVDGAPEGLSVDGDSLAWNPPKTFTPGDYEFTVKVTDTGSPAKTASQTVNMKVQDDTAALTRFTAVVGLDGVPAAWFWNQIENKRPELKMGDRLTIADIDAEITQISPRYVLITDSQGVWKVDLGDTVRQRALVEPVEDSDVEPADDDSDVEAEDQPVVAEPEKSITQK